MIDFKFIQELEGNVCTGYVPDPHNSASGVTIGCGFDLGARNKDELCQAFSQELAQKLVPYARLKKLDAVQALEDNPLTLTDDEVVEINRFSKQQAVQRLSLLWGEDPNTSEAFSELPAPCQTVIASVAFQYGNLKLRTPNFWLQITTKEWAAALENLRNFGDRYATRRNKEADVLEAWLVQA